MFNKLTHNSDSFTKESSSETIETVTECAEILLTSQKSSNDLSQTHKSLVTEDPSGKSKCPYIEEVSPRLAETILKQIDTLA